MRYLQITPEQAECYSLAYIALSYPEAPVKGPAALRQHAKLMDKWESHGTPTEGVGFALPKGGGAVIALEDTEHQMLAACVEAMPWNPGYSRKVVPLLDLLDQAPVTTPPDKS